MHNHIHQAAQEMMEVEEFPLHIVAYLGDHRMVKHFVEEENFDVNDVNRSDETVLDVADTSVCQYLLSKGAKTHKDMCPELYMD